ncbi:MAG: hypothetical protein M3Q08_10250 [Pseudomonadota bacterium]|nr:hypothetical protein [Pseudomonadota bacterium]
MEDIADKALIRTEEYPDLDQALVEADVAILSGPKPVEVTVTDHAGTRHYTKVLGGGAGF